MSIDKTVNKTKIYDGDDTAGVGGSDKDDLQTVSRTTDNLLEQILIVLKKIELHLAMASDESISELDINQGD